MVFISTLFYTRKQLKRTGLLFKNACSIFAFTNSFKDSGVQTTDEAVYLPSGEAYIKKSLSCLRIYLIELPESTFALQSIEDGQM